VTVAVKYSQKLILIKTCRTQSQDLLFISRVTNSLKIDVV